MARRRTNGFTLIELLTVLVIAAIVIGLTIPTVTKLMSSGGLNAASREVANTLGLARQYAITHRVTTRVVFPYIMTPATSAGAAGTNAVPVYQSYAVLEVSPINNYLTKWETLPLGTVFMNNNPTVTTGYSSLDNLSAANLSFPNTNVNNNATLAYIEFNPTGAATPNNVSGGGSALTITEGFVNNGGTVTLTLTSVTNNAGTSVLANLANISVDTLVGRIQVTRP